jgi:hypothetical protein
MSSWLQSLADDVADKGLSAIMRALGKIPIVEAILIAFCGLAVLVGVGFIAAGGYLSLRQSFSPWLSGLVVGGVILFLAFFAILMLWLSMRNKGAAQEPPPPRPEPPELGSSRVNDVTQLGEAVGRQLSERGVRVTDVVIAALVAGAVLGARPALRQRRRQRRQNPRRASTTTRPHTNK